MGEETEKQKLKMEAPPEKPEEKKPEEAKPAQPGGKLSNFQILGMAWMFLMCGTGAVSLYYLAPTEGFFAKVLARAGSVAITPAAVLALAVGLASLFFVLRRFRHAFVYARPRQGTYSRLFCYLFVGLILFFGAYSFTRADLGDKWWDAIWTTAKPILGFKPALRPIHFPAAFIFFAGVFASHLFLNKEKWADFLIETQGELLKVSWPPRKEHIGSSVVVIIVVVTLSLFLFFVDEILRRVMPKLGIGF